MIPHILGSKPVVEAMEADLKPRVELLRQLVKVRPPQR